PVGERPAGDGVRGRVLPRDREPWIPAVRGRVPRRLSRLRHAALPRAPSHPEDGPRQEAPGAPHAPPLPEPRARLGRQRPVLGLRVRDAAEDAPLVPTPRGESGATIRAVAMAVPDRQVSNPEIAGAIGVDEAWIAKRTGTSTRPWAVDGERLSDFAARVGAEALGRAELDPSELDLVLVATSTADEITPNAAPLLA